MATPKPATKRSNVEISPVSPSSISPSDMPRQHPLARPTTRVRATAQRKTAPQPAPLPATQPAPQPAQMNNDRIIVRYAYGPREVSPKEAQIYINNHLGRPSLLDEVLCTYDRGTGKNVLKVSLLARWTPRARMLTEGPNGTRFSMIGGIEKVSGKQGQGVARQPKPTPTAKGIIEHRDLVRGENEKENSKELMLALNASQNRITAAHFLGKSGKTAMVTFSSEEVPYQISPATYVNQGKPLMVSLTKPKPVRCNKCQKHGHLSANCPQVKPICPYCGYEHTFNKCPVRGDIRQYYCMNCHHAGLNPYGHGACSRFCPEYVKYTRQLDRIQETRELTRAVYLKQNKPSVKVTKMQITAPEPDQNNRAQPKTATRTINQTPTKEVSQKNDVSQKTDVITKNDVIELIETIDKVLSDKLQWEHRGLITEIAKEKLYGPVIIDVEMTSTPNIPGYSAQPRSLATSRFTASPVVDPQTPKAATVKPTFNTKEGQTKLAQQISKTPNITPATLKFDPQTFKYTREAGEALLQSTPKNNVAMSPEAANTPFTDLGEATYTAQLIQTEQTNKTSPQIRPTMAIKKDRSYIKTEMSDDSDVSIDVRQNSNSSPSPKKLTKRKTSPNRSQKKLLETPEAVDRITRENAANKNKQNLN